MSEQGRREAALRAFNRTGVKVFLIPNATATQGLETKLDGTEDDAVEVKGAFKDKSYSYPKSDIEKLREEADIAGSQYLGQTFTFAAVAIEFEPDTNTRLVRAADGANYNVIRVTPEFYGEALIRYELLVQAVT